MNWQGRDKTQAPAEFQAMDPKWGKVRYLVLWFRERVVSVWFLIYDFVISSIKASFHFLSLEQSLPLLDFLNKRIDIDNLSQLVLNLSSFVQFYPKLQSSTKPARMPPPGGTGGTAGWGFIKEKPDPWEVTLDILF